MDDVEFWKKEGSCQMLSRRMVWWGLRKLLVMITLTLNIKKILKICFQVLNFLFDFLFWYSRGHTFFENWFFSVFFSRQHKYFSLMSYHITFFFLVALLWYFFVCYHSVTLNCLNMFHALIVFKTFTTLIMTRGVFLINFIIATVFCSDFIFYIMFVFFAKFFRSN